MKNSLKIALDWKIVCPPQYQRQNVETGGLGFVYGFSCWNPVTAGDAKTRSILFKLKRTKMRCNNWNCSCCFVAFVSWLVRDPYKFRKSHIFRHLNIVIIIVIIVLNLNFIKINVDVSWACGLMSMVVWANNNEAQVLGLSYYNYKFIYVLNR